MTEAKDKTVVIINDDSTQLKQISEIISGDHIETVMFQNGIEALEYLRYSNAPDLVITDLHIPDVDGWRICRLLRSPEFISANNIPVLVTSAVYSGADVREISRDLGANDFLTLPADSSVVKSAVDGLLEGKSINLQPLALIIEDDPEMARLLKRGLTPHGYEPVIAKTAEEAIEIFEEKRPSVVFMDHNLNGVYGTDIIHSFKQPGSEVVVIVITGSLSSDLALEYTRRGADAFVNKPFSIKKLISLLDKTQRQRSLLRVEELLVERGKQLRDNDAKIMQASKLASLGEMAAGIAHEINNPVNGIVNCADILVDELSPDEPVKKFAEIIKTEGYRVSSIVRRMLSFSRKDDEELIETDIEQVIDQAMVLLKSQIMKARITVNISIPKTIPPIRCKVVQVQQVILNMILNSISSLNKRYPETSPDKVLNISVSDEVVADQPSILIDITDHGKGIPADELPYLFDPFFTTKENGTGLGLSIAQGIVERHGGRIWVESEVDSYCRFHITLPLSGTKEILK